MGPLFYRLVLLNIGRSLLGDRREKDPELDLSVHRCWHELHRYLLHGNVAAPLGREPIGNSFRRSSLSLGWIQVRPLLPSYLHGTVSLGDLLVDVPPEILREDLELKIAFIRTVGAKIGDFDLGREDRTGPPHCYPRRRTEPVGPAQARPTLPTFWRVVLDHTHAKA